MIDNIQNTNARFIDNYGSNHRTSIKMINPPGGRSSFSLGWGFEEPKKNSTPIMSRNNNMVNNNSQLNNTGYGMNYQQYNNNVYNNDRSTYGQRVMETTNYQANNYNFQQTVPNQFNNGNNYQLNNGNMNNNYNTQQTYQQYDPQYNPNPVNNGPIVSNHIQPNYDNSNSRFKYNNRNHNTKDDIFPQSTSNQSPQDYSRSNPYCNNYSD